MDLFERVSKLRYARTTLVAGVVIMLALTAGLSQPKEAGDEFMSKLGLKSGELVTIAQDQMGKSEMAITMAGQDYVIDYTLQSNRSKRFRLMVQQENGELVEQTAPTVSTIRGSLRGVEGSRVVGCLTKDGCCAKIKLPSGENCYLEPIDRLIKNRVLAGVHVVYTEDQVISLEGTCGAVTNLAQAKQNFAVPTTSAASVLQECELAVDADFEYFSIFGSAEATLAQIELIINLVNDQYESEVGIRHTVSTAIIRTTSNDPYSATGARNLLDQLKAANSDGFDGDLCHLFTGKNLDSNTIGIAFVGAVCSQGFGFGLSQDVTPLSNMTDLVAHELGHNWNQEHCTCENHTMFAQLTGANDFNDVLTVPNLISYRDTRRCLDSITPPLNDDLVGEFNIAGPDFSVTGSNINASTEDDEENLSEVGSSVWWFMDADENGTITLDTFGSDFDTQLFVYESVPDGGFSQLELVGNNNDTQDPTSQSMLQSQVTVDMTAGTRYQIRVGGVRSSTSISDGSEGNIVLNGTFVSGAVLGDFDADGDVDCNDLDGYIGNIGANANAALARLDLDGDGIITAADANTHITTLVQTSNGLTGTFPGDLNCDGAVTVLEDAFTLIANLGDSVTTYAQGDLNFDGFVEVLEDAFPLIENLGQTNTP
ncbi:zinc-dependent metalloprotease [Mariniblastus sp.]|nr:zinc-dependent metalloprotease [Mariniblastus sp.]